MKLEGFQVFNFRNIIDSGWVRADRLNALIAQNECGKTNLLEAFYKMNPYQTDQKYNVAEDWPADDWGNRNSEAVVCKATFTMTLEELTRIQSAAPKKVEGETPATLPTLSDTSPHLTVTIERTYSSKSIVNLHPNFSDLADVELAKKWVLENMPKFVYMDDYVPFCGSTDLAALCQRLNEVQSDRSRLSREDQSILVVLDLAKIDIRDLHAKGGKKEDRTIRGFDTIQAQTFLTKQFAVLWKQKEVRFHIRVDHTTLDIHVEDVGLGMPVRLERRSQGFRWYVSFIWQFSHASKGAFKNCVLLLDEPGVHLHPAGHRDLLDFLEELSGSNTVIYTTHLATMIDTGFPERIRIMEVKNHHASVSNSMYSKQVQPMMVIEQALGVNPSMSGLLGTRQTLIVEGGEDAIILQKLSAVFERGGLEGLNERIYLMPALGASKTPMYAGFMIGHGLDAAVLLDSDNAGREAKKKIEELFLKDLAAQSGKGFRAMFIGDSAGISGDAAIEDLFPAEFFLQCCGDAYRIQISESDLPDTPAEQICRRVEHVIRTRGMGEKLDKKRVLGEILRRFEAMTVPADLPEGTIERAQLLIRAINRAFGHTQQSANLQKPAFAPALNQ